jgi:hypothetical protein
MLFSRLLSIVPLACVVAAAQDAKPNLSGNWQLKEPTKTASAMTMVIEQKGANVHITKAVTGADGKEQKLEFHCTTDGKECEVKGSKISLWFDGAALVEMDAASEAISKVTMKLDGDQLKVELSHIFPDGPAETYVLAKN